jgi:hypothetical protein
MDVPSDNVIVGAKAVQPKEVEELPLFEAVVTANKRKGYCDEQER